MAFPVPLRAALVAALVCCSLPGAAAAQSLEMQELLNRVDRLQRELSTLQRQVYRGDPPPATALPPAAAQRAPVAAGPADGSAFARLDVRLTQLENELRALTGRIEELTYAQSQASGRHDKAVKDLEFRLSRLEQGGEAAAPADASPAATRLGPSSSAAPQLRPPASAASQPGASQSGATQSAAANPGLGAPPRDLGTVPAGSVTAPAEGAGTRAPAQGGTPQEQYDYAMALLTRDQNLPEAEKALRGFVDAHPDSPLTSNAQYWLGETYFARKDYQQAAAAFAEGYKKFPKSAKAPDTLLKLGMSLAALNKRKEACTAYGRLLEAHPTAGAAIKGRAQREQKAIGCT